MAWVSVQAEGWTDWLDFQEASSMGVWVRNTGILEAGCPGTAGGLSTGY